MYFFLIAEVAKFWAKFTCLGNKKIMPQMHPKIPKWGPICHLLPGTFLIQFQKAQSSSQKNIKYNLPLCGIRNLVPEKLDLVPGKLDLVPGWVLVAELVPDFFQVQLVTGMAFWFPFGY